MRFFTSDTHFGHENIIKYCNRPFANKDEMDNALIDNWNAVVKPEDTVYHLGDFAMGKRDALPLIVGQLNGYKILIRGNHDRSAKQMLEAGFNEVHEKLQIDFFGEKVWLSHYPYPYIEFDPYIEDHDDPDAHHEIMKDVGQPKDDFHTWLFNGHIHTAWKVKKWGSRKNGMINVGVDQWNFTPVLDSQLKAFLDEIRK